eukprot:7955562-Pyramimonas_sp.AAC.1
MFFQHPPCLSARPICSGDSTLASGRSIPWLLTHCRNTPLLRSPRSNAILVASPAHAQALLKRSGACSRRWCTTSLLDKDHALKCCTLARDAPDGVAFSTVVRHL